MSNTNAIIAFAFYPNVVESFGKVEQGSMNFPVLGVEESSA